MMPNSLKPRKPKSKSKYSLKSDFSPLPDTCGRETHISIAFFQRICVFNQTRLIRYESYVVDGQSFCTNQKFCQNTNTNQTFECPLWSAYCKPHYESVRKLNGTSGNEEKLEDVLDNPMHERYVKYKLV